ncbi:ankyrin [Panus rudis PR-1116 ss-1]|nr:ankyrin [Panus rudis PR-1116 ss-1]
MTSSFAYSPAHHHVDRGSLPSVSVSLFEAAATANEKAFSLALRAGADVNASDAKGRTVIGYVIGGDRWEEVDASDASYALPRRLRMLRTLLDHPDLSLQTLNAPQVAMRGVTPLGLASWLNIPEMVHLLLEYCPGLVSVDGMDSLGATALMYAARDGSADVVRYLLSNGARPDYRDVNHRTSIQHALRHPQVLWLCESALRVHRARENLTDPNKRNLSTLRAVDEYVATLPDPQCHPRLFHAPNQELDDLTDSLITTVLNNDVQQLYRQLFSFTSSPSSSSSFLDSLPFILVNHPDSHGWSPIHYCVSAPEPSKSILDMLYRAGADVSLYTTSGHGTPLHCLAHKARASTPASIHAFVRHLVFDLRAPLSARDQNRDTCLHVAAEHGESLEVLAALLACDTTGAVQEMRNSRGLTALEVAKPHFRAAFGVAEQARCGSSASTRTVRPSTTSSRSDSSLASLVAENVRRQQQKSGRISHQPGRSISHVNASTLPLRILDNLRRVSNELTLDPTTIDTQRIEQMLRETSDMGEDLIMHFQARLHDVTQDFSGAQTKYEQVDTLMEEVMRLVETAYGERFEEIERAWDTPDSVRRRTTDSGDSEATAVSSSSNLSEFGLKSATLDNDSGVFDAYDDASIVSSRTFPTPLPAISIQSATTGYFQEGLLGDEYSAPRSISIPSSPLSIPPSPTASNAGLLRIVTPWMGGAGLPKKKSKASLKLTKSFEDLRIPSPAISTPGPGSSSKAGTSKLKAWFKKKLLHDTSPRMLIQELDDHVLSPSSVVNEYGTSGRVSRMGWRPPSAQGRVERQAAASAARRILDTSGKDLRRIEAFIQSANRYITHANRSITQAEKLISRCTTEREVLLGRANLIQQMNEVQSALEDIILSPEPEEDDPEQVSGEFEPVTIPTSNRNSQLIFPRPPPSPPSLSSKSSLSSLTSTLIEGEEEDLRALRRLLTRKIDERTECAVEEIENALQGLRVVKDVVTGLRKRTTASSL